MKKLVIVLLLVVSSATMMAQTPKIIISDKDGWHKIGETTVDFKAESDNIVVIGADRFAAIQIKVTDAPMLLVSFDIYFEDGKRQNVPVGLEIRGPGQTKVIDLKGEKSIKKIHFYYKTIGNDSGKKAHVELWGLKTNHNKK
jgi:hypothetical protein